MLVVISDILQSLLVTADPWPNSINHRYMSMRDEDDEIFICIAEI
jgi:hypothetical protein